MSLAADSTAVLQSLAVSEGYEVVSSRGAPSVAAPYSRLPERVLPVVSSKTEELSGDRMAFARDIGFS